MKKIFTMMCAAVLAVCSVSAEVLSTKTDVQEPNLLGNGGFEDNSCNFLGCSFEDWTTPLGQCSANAEDKYEGEVSLMLDVKSTYTIDQPVALSDDNYIPGTYFKVVMYYKVLTMPDGGAVTSDCYWEAKPGADAEAIKAHDAEILTQDLTTAVSEQWDSLVMVTTKPEKSSYLRVRVRVLKGTKVLLDAFRVEKTEGEVPAEPFIAVSPKTVSSVSVYLGDSKDFQTIHVSQGNVESPTTFRIGGEDAAHFSLSAYSLPVDQSEIDLVVTYSPTEAGTHRASLIFDNEKHTTILPDMIILNGSCVDTTKVPELHATPSELAPFEAVVGQDQKKTITFSSVNATDFVYMRVEHDKGAAFTIDGTMIAKNSSRDVEVRFAPIEAGEYESRIIVYSEGAEDLVISLKGTGKPATPETVDWQTGFVFDMSSPLALLDERFDAVSHNKTLLLENWQNVAAADQRPWWGFDEAQTSPVRGENRYAKATSYQFGKDSTGTWEMWLVTPALDYHNAQSRIFSFSIMGEYLPEENNLSTIELVFIDATDPQLPFFQVFDGLAFPRTTDEQGIWVPFDIHLENQENIPDAFFMAFRYTCPNGTWGAETYYIDNVSWGVVPQGIENAADEAVQGKKILREGQILILRGERIFNALGQELR